MQLFVKKVDGKTVVLEADADETVHALTLMSTCPKLAGTRGLMFESRDICVCRSLQMGKFKERVASAEGLPLEELRLLFSGKQLEDAKMLADYRIRDGSTIYSALRLLGGAAERAKVHLEQKRRLHRN